VILSLIPHHFNFRNCIVGNFLKLIYIENYYILAADHEAFRIAKYVILLK